MIVMFSWDNDTKSVQDIISKKRKQFALEKINLGGKTLETFDVYVKEANAM